MTVSAYPSVLLEMKCGRHNWALEDLLESGALQKFRCVNLGCDLQIYPGMLTYDGLRAWWDARQAATRGEEASSGE